MIGWEPTHPAATLRNRTNPDRKRSTGRSASTHAGAANRRADTRYPLRLGPAEPAPVTATSSATVVGQVRRTRGQVKSDSRSSVSGFTVKCGRILQAVDEDKPPARQGVVPEVLPHQSLQAIEGLAHVGGITGKPHAAPRPATQHQDLRRRKTVPSPNASSTSQAAASGAATSTKAVSCFNRQ